MHATLIGTPRPNASFTCTWAVSRNLSRHDLLLVLLTGVWRSLAVATAMACWELGGVLGHFMTDPVARNHELVPLWWVVEAWSTVTLLTPSSPLPFSSLITDLLLDAQSAVPRPLSRSSGPCF